MILETRLLTADLQFPTFRASSTEVRYNEQVRRNWSEKNARLESTIRRNCCLLQRKSSKTDRSDKSDRSESTAWSENIASSRKVNYRENWKILENRWVRENWSQEKLRAHRIEQWRNSRRPEKIYLIVSNVFASPNKNSNYGNNLKIEWDRINLFAVSNMRFFFLQNSYNSLSLQNVDTLNMQLDQLTIW